MLWTLVLVVTINGTAMMSFPHSFKSESRCIDRGEKFKRDVGTGVASVRYSCLPNTDPS